MSGIVDKNYMDTIKSYDIEARHEDFAWTITTADQKLIAAILTCYIRQERFCDGLIAAAIANGNMVSILKRLAVLNKAETANSAG